MPQIIHDDALTALRGMPDNSVDAVVTDPPYGLSNTTPDKVADTIVRWASGDREYTPRGRGFMGAAWDAFVPPPAVWDECLRVLKPGGHLVVFAGSRTQDLMGISIRLAQFEIRENVAWMYGSGFPKSHNIAKATGRPQDQGLGTALKPGHEPIILARKPFLGTVAANTLEWGTGGLNIDATRIEHRTVNGGNLADNPHLRESINGSNGGKIFPTETERRVVTPNVAGRWPANVVLDPDTAHALDQQSGNRKSGGSTHERSHAHNGIYGAPSGERQTRREPDEGGASRFFKVVEPDPPFMYAAKAPKRERPSYTDETGQQVQHPTVKPVSVIRWLVRLVTPVGGTVLDPFGGSGTTLEAALLEGMDPILIEAHGPYIPLIEARRDRVAIG